MSNKIEISREEYDRYMSMKDKSSNNFLNMSSYINFDISFTSVLFYFGWFIVFLGLISFYIIGTSKYGAEFMSTLSLLYTILFTFVGNQLWSNPDSRTFGGLLIMCAICMVPVTVITMMNQILKKEWLQSRISRITGEIATLLAACLAIYKYQGFTFYVSIAALMIWVLGEELVLSVQKSDKYDYLVNYGFFEVPFRFVTIIFGLGMVLLAYKIEEMQLCLVNDYSFWLYLIGVISFWIALSFDGSGSQSGKFIYGCINMIMILIWMFVIKRNVFLVMGLLGMTIYQGNSMVKFIFGNIFFRNFSNDQSEKNKKASEYHKSYQIGFSILTVMLANTFETYNIRTPIVDIGFWMYLSGAIALWLHIMEILVADSDNLGKRYKIHPEAIKLTSVFFNLIYVILSIKLVKIIFLILGTLGMTYYITHVMNKLFNGMIAYSTGLIMVGISIMTCSQYVKEYYSL